MRRFPRHLLVAAAAAALGTGACTSTISDPPPPALDLVEERLAQLSQRAEAFASLIVDADLAAAFVVDDGTATRWHLTPTVSEVDDSGLPRPAVPFAELTPAEIAAEARALADECPDSYAAEVTALTPSALLGEVRCVEDRTLARLHGEPLPTFSQQWSAADWQRLLDLTIEVNSPSALETYKENVQLQDAAHESTQTIIRTMLERDATFLQNMADHPSKFADLQREHEQRYIDMATGSWKPEELSLDWVLGKIGEVATFVQDHRNKQTAEAAAMIGVLNDAVTGTLKTEQLRGDINAMSEPTGDGGTGWPMPAKGSYELEFNTRWFKDHITFWSGLSSDLGPVISTGAGVPAIEPMFLQFPGFSATATSGLNTLAGEINSKALARAQAATKDMSEKLDTTIRTYLEGEGLNAAEAKKLQDLLDE